MTGLQLAVLLRQYYSRLLSEISRVAEQLPDSMKVERQSRNFIGTGVSVYAEFPVLSDLYDWASELHESIETLENLTKGASK